MKVFRLITISIFFSLLVYFSIFVLKKEESKGPVFKQEIIFINNGAGKPGYICAEGMEEMTSLVLEGIVYTPPLELEASGGVMMGNEDLFTVKGAVEAILTAKATNNKDWEYSMTEYYLMKQLDERYRSLGQSAKDILDREDSKFKSYKKITMDLNVRIGNNVLCLIKCYSDDETYSVESVMLRDIGGQLFQMKPRSQKEIRQSLYVLSSYTTGLWRQIIDSRDKKNIIRDMLRIP